MRNMGLILISSFLKRCKSLVALGMLFMGMAQGKRCYYTAPIKALVSEKFFDLVQVLGSDNVRCV